MGTGGLSDGASSVETMTEAPPNERSFDPDASIVLVGCRGAGKRSLGFIGALHLRRRFVTEEHFFQRATGLSKSDFLYKYGKEAFGRQISTVFRQMLETCRSKCVIECGMSSLTEQNQAELKRYSESHPVIYIHREREHILPFLDRADADQLLQADQSHRACSNYEYFNLFDPSGSSSTNSTSGSETSTPLQWDSLSTTPSRMLYAREDFTGFLDILLGQAWRRIWTESPFSLKALPPQLRGWSYALRLRLSFLVETNLSWEEFEACGDCVELIIDHWPDDLYNLIARYVALIRRKLAVPIIFHVEENPRGERKRPQEERDKTDADLLDLGLRLNVAYISLDLQRSPSLLRRILAHKGRSQVIGNYWYTGLRAPAWSSGIQLHDYKAALDLGCDVVRMVRFCAGDSPQELLVEFRDNLSAGIPDTNKPPLVAFDYSVLGISSPQQTRIMAPVKLPNVPSTRDHLATVSTAENTFAKLFRDNRLDALDFHTVGANVSYSITPAIHSAAYTFAGMPHRYSLSSCNSLDDLSRLCASRTFGGATLAAPFKVTVLPLLTLRSHHAAAIGAANIVLPLRGSPNTDLVLEHANARNKAGEAGAFYGDNTDYSAILSCLRRAVSPRNSVRSTTTALVVGAGGMARAAVYALLRLGCRNVFIWNRTVGGARSVAGHFNEWARGQGGLIKEGSDEREIVRVLERLDMPWPGDYAPPTMIVSCVPAISTDGGPAADFEVPGQWLGSTTGGVVVELAYEPLITPLVAQMQLLAETKSPAWVVVDGLEVVSEMAIEAFELMTGRPAPKRLMRDVCRRTWEERLRGRREREDVDMS